MFYLPTEFHSPSSNCSLVTANELTGKENLFTATMTLYYILQKYYLCKICLLAQDLLLHTIPGP